MQTNVKFCFVFCSILFCFVLSDTKVNNFCDLNVNVNILKVQTNFLFCFVCFVLFCQGKIINSLRETLLFSSSFFFYAFLPVTSILLVCKH